MPDIITAGAAISFHPGSYDSVSLPALQDHLVDVLDGTAKLDVTLPTMECAFHATAASLRKREGRSFLQHIDDLAFLGHIGVSLDILPFVTEDLCVEKMADALKICRGLAFKLVNDDETVQEWGIYEEPFRGGRVRRLVPRGTLNRLIGIHNNIVPLPEMFEVLHRHGIKIKKETFLNLCFNRENVLGDGRYEELLGTGRPAAVKHPFRGKLDERNHFFGLPLHHAAALAQELMRQRWVLDSWMSSEDAAERLGVGPARVSVMAREGILPSVMIMWGTTGAPVRRYDPEVITAAVKQRKRARFVRRSQREIPDKSSIFEDAFGVHEAEYAGEKIRKGGYTERFDDRAYLEMARKYRTLSRERQHRLLRLVKADDPEVSKKARETLFNHNLPLVVWVAQKYRGRGLDLMDLIMEGNFGLMRAIDKFDSKKINPKTGRPYTLSTYAVLSIRRSVERAIYNTSRVIRIPIGVQEKARSLNQLYAAMAATLHELPTVAQLARESGIPVEEVDALLQDQREILSLDAPLDKNSSRESNLDDIHAAKDDVDAEASNEMLKVMLYRAFDAVHLTERQREVLEFRYGIGEAESPHSLEEVGDLLGLTRERVRQIERDAKERIRSCSHRPTVRALSEYLAEKM